MRARGRVRVYRNRLLLFRSAVVCLVALAAVTLVLRNFDVQARTPMTDKTVLLPADHPSNPRCFPSCPPNDGRFLSLAGTALNTFVGGSTSIGIRVNGSETNFKIGIFDGDYSGLWDQIGLNSTAGVLKFELFADPDGDGTPNGASLGDNLDESVMANNGWTYFLSPNYPAALAGGKYTYQLKISFVTVPPANSQVQNSFKVGADSATTELFITPQILSLQAFQNTFDEFKIIHPNSVPHETTPSNYDGIWNFSFPVAQDEKAINVWDGDFDIGYDATNSLLDKSDKDLVGKLPDDFVGSLGFVFTGQGAKPEGVGLTDACAGSSGLAPQGCPPDDSISPFFRRKTTTMVDTKNAPIVVRLIPPTGAPFVNSNPSGNSEFELTRIAVDPGDLFAGITDFTVATLDLQPGSTPETWTYQIEGMDLGNLFVLRFNQTLLVEPYTIGDTVWCDSHNPGTQDIDEAGVPGVLVQLLDAVGNVVKTTTTDGSGKYSFAVEPGAHRVRIAASNFDVGGPLFGRTQTNNYGVANERTQTLTNSNLLDYDFGYDCNVTICLVNIGDTVFKDIDGDGVQDAGEPGIPGVTLDLLAQTACAGPYVNVGTTTTDANGNYLFANLAPGCYRVDVTDTGNVLSSFTKTSGAAGVNGNSQADPYDLTTTLSPCVGNLTADFGYTEGTDFCEPECENQVGPVGHMTTSFDGNGNLVVKYEQALNVQDNTYGANVIGWSTNRGFNALVGSDKAKFTFKDKNGVVVLSFFMDYISAKTGTPSGYASLGPDGGDGSMVSPVGTRAYLLSFNTSEARNLNDNGYCSAPLSCTFAGVNLLVNSPPASSSFVVSNPAFLNWNFVNTYEMKISAAAFGAAGFGTVEVSEVHNSPSKGGCNQIFPVPCTPVGQPSCSIQSVEFKLGGKTLEWKLKNNGTTDIELTDIINFAFPAVNGKVKKIKLDGDTIYDSTLLSSPVTLTEAQFKAGTDAKRTIKKGDTDRLIFEFENEISTTASNYSGKVKFGTCEVNVP